MDRPAFTDQMGREVHVPQHPERIVSLVPSITELLFSLGLGEKVMGVTRFCIYPKEAREQAENIGGTKELHLARIADLKPDLIIGSKEENSPKDIKALSANHDVWMSDVQTVSDGIEMIRHVGAICGVNEEARKMAHRIECGFTDLSGGKSMRRQRVAYLIWYDPIMVSGRRNFINSVIEKCGWKNVFEDFETTGNRRYPKVTIDQLKEAQPAVIFLSSEPYPFKEKHVETISDAIPDCKVRLVDGDLFSWYGSRMLKMPAYLEELRREVESQ